jgi:hypothetical protein
MNAGPSSLIAWGINGLSLLTSESLILPLSHITHLLYIIQDVLNFFYAERWLQPLPLGASSPFPVNLHSTGDDCQGGPARSGSYQLANDGPDMEAPQSWDQRLEG